MRAILALLLSLLLASAWAQVPMTGAGKGTPAASVTFSAAYIASSGQQEAAGGTTTNYSISLGAADSNRVIALFICARQSAGTAGISSVTWSSGSVTATQIAGSVYAANGVGTCQWWYASDSSSNTTATVAVTYSATTARTGLAAYRVITATPTPSGSTFSSGSGGATATISIPSGGATLTGAFEVFSATSLSWANATQDYQGNTTSAFTSAIATASNPAVSGGSNTTAISAAAWGP